MFSWRHPTLKTLLFIATRETWKGGPASPAPQANAFVGAAKLCSFCMWVRHLVVTHFTDNWVLRSALQWVCV
jgi:hypothetical protein